MKLLPEMRRIPAKELAAFRALFLVNHLFPKSGAIKGWKDGLRGRIAEHLRRGGPGKVIAVDRVRDISPEDFRKRYLSLARPVVFEKAAARWPCGKNWSFEGFKRRFGGEMIKLVNRRGLANDDEVPYDAPEFTEEIRFGEFLDQ